MTGFIKAMLICDIRFSLELCVKKKKSKAFKSDAILDNISDPFKENYNQLLCINTW